MIGNLQVLRAIAAMMVVYQHSYRLLTGHSARGWEWGGAGVDVFFVISGFIMVYTTQGGTHPLHFWRNRLQRIVPLYWLMTLAVFAVAVVLPSVLGTTTASAVDLLKSLLFIPYVKGGAAVEPMLMVGWSLNLEMFFYLVFGFCLFLGRRSVWACAGLLAALVALHPVARGPIASFMTQPLMLGFIAGMLIAKFRPTLPFGVALAILPVCFAGFVVHVAYFPNVDHGVARLVPATLMVIAFLSLEDGRRGWIKTQWVFLGSASYAVYLTHPFVTQAVSEVAPKGGALGIISFSVSMVGSAVAGSIVYLAVERPITDHLKRRRNTEELVAAAHSACVPMNDAPTHPPAEGNTLIHVPANVPDFGHGKSQSGPR